jgi:hypothetical protein
MGNRKLRGKYRKKLGETEENSSLNMKKIRADGSQGILVIIRCRILCLPECYPKI